MIGFICACQAVLAEIHVPIKTVLRYVPYIYLRVPPTSRMEPSTSL